MNDSQAKSLENLLQRIAVALESQSGTGIATPPNWADACAFVWQSASRTLRPVKDSGALPLPLFVGISPQMETLIENTKHFAAGLPANNALLWGARGMGKSSLVKAVHANSARCNDLKLIEIYREDIGTLPILLDLLRGEKNTRFILFCDDLSFDEHDSNYKSLKAVLEGGIESRPSNVVFYATSNRRHLLKRDMIENERSTAIHPGESVEEKVSLSDRFGLWLGFYPCSQDEYLQMINGYAKQYGLRFDQAGALEWFRTRGSRSGRVAWQYILYIAGQQGKKLS